MPADLTPAQIAALRIITEKARAREHHDKAAAALKTLVELGAVDVEIVIPGGRRFTVKDNFAEMAPTKLVYFDRYELRELRELKPK